MDSELEIGEIEGGLETHEIEEDKRLKWRKSSWAEELGEGISEETLSVKEAWLEEVAENQDNISWDMEKGIWEFVRWGLSAKGKRFSLNKA